MEILKSANATLNTILCCKQKCRTAEETESIKIDKRTHNDKSEDFSNDENSVVLKLIIRPVLIDEAQHPVKPPRAPKRLCVQESKSECSKRRKSISINNSESFCNHHTKFAEHYTCEQQQQQNKKGIGITIARDQHCGDLLSHRNEPRKDISSETDTHLSKSISVQRLPVTTSTQSKNSQFNCSSAIQDRGKKSNTSSYNNSSTSTEYIPLRRTKLEPLTSTKVDSTYESRSSSIRKIHKQIAAIFRRCFHKTSNLNK